MKVNENTILNNNCNKPWLGYYSSKPWREYDVNKTLYANFKEIAIANKDELAIIDFNTGEKISYSQLLDRINKLAASLSKNGYGLGTRIGMLGFNSTFDSVVLLAANALGAHVKFVNPDAGVQGMAQSIKELDLLFLENILQEAESAINLRGIPVVLDGKTDASVRSNCSTYDTFIESGAGNTWKEAAFDKNRSSLTIFSSGSTGEAKPIVHSDYSVNMAILKMLYMDYPLNKDNAMVKVIPSHIGLGVITTMLTALMVGMPYIQLKGWPDIVNDLGREFITLISQFKNWIKESDINGINGLIIFAAPIFAKALLMNLEVVSDLSYIKGILLGGSKMTKEDLDIMDKEFGKRGLMVPVCNGYGQNELGGAVTLNSVKHNKNGSAGFPVYGTEIRIVDRYSHEDVELYQIGQILEKSGSEFLCYDNMPERTEQSHITLSDGSVWYDSTDLGYMDEDGFLFITGRTTRVVIKFDHKVSMDVVEEKIKSVNGVMEVAVVPARQSEVDGSTIAFVTTTNGVIKDNVIECIKSDACGLTVFEMPVHFEFVDIIPRMNNGKVDYVQLEKIAKKIKM